MKLLYISAAAACTAFSFSAPAAAQTGPADPTVNQLIIYGDDACPQSTNDEITVCARRPESERYRIPEALRDLGNPASNSWANRALELQYVGRTGTGSCTPVGPGGAHGCLTQLINQARAERAGGDAVNWNALIDEARQERLSRIDADSEAIEREQSAPR